jgi:hypothetical protein
MSIVHRLGGFAALSACFLLSAGSSYGITLSTPTIFSFVATPAGTGPYAGNEAIYSSFTGNTAKISANGSGSPSYVTCTTEGGCAGIAANFSLLIIGAGLTPFDISIDGTLSPATTVLGRVDLSIDGSPQSHLPFTVGSSPFSTLIYGGILPAGGNTTITGDLFLTMAQGQTITLPSSFRLDINTPEPASVASLGIGLGAGLLFLARRRKKQ